MSSQNEPEYKNPYKVSSRHDSMRKSGVGDRILLLAACGIGGAIVGLVGAFYFAARPSRRPGRNDRLMETEMPESVKMMLVGGAVLGAAAGVGIALQAFRATRVD